VIDLGRLIVASLGRVPAEVPDLRWISPEVSCCGPAVPPGLNFGRGSGPLLLMQALRGILPAPQGAPLSGSRHAVQFLGLREGKSWSPTPSDRSPTKTALEPHKV